MFFGNNSVFNMSTKLYQYPNPFLDMFNHYIPTNLKELFKWYEYVMFSNPIVAGAIKNFVSYPITDIIIEGSDADTIKDYLEEIDWKSLFIEIGINKFVYGNSFVVMFTPFIRMFKCKKCNNNFSDSIVDYKYDKLGFQTTCPKCGYTGPVESKELIDKSDINKLTFKIWNPKLIGIKEHPFTNKKEFYSEVPKKLRQGVLKGDFFYLRDTPGVIIKAAYNNKQIKFKNNSVYHLKNNTLAGKSSEWGTSPLMPLLKNMFYIQTLRKANEAIALEHIVPLRIIFPQIDASTANVVNLSLWESAFTEAVNNWKVDQNNIFISNVPVGVQYMGGQFKMLEVSQYIDVLTKEIIAGLGIPYEFVFGGLTWSATSITLRMLENQFSTFINELKDILKWMIKHICTIYDLKYPNEVDFVKFKMVDDIQQKQFLADLAVNGKISMRTLMNSLGIDYDEELKDLKDEVKIQAELSTIQQLAQQGILGQLGLAQQQPAAEEQSQEQQPIQQQMEVPAEPKGPKDEIGNPEEHVLPPRGEM